MLLLLFLKVIFQALAAVFEEFPNFWSNLQNLILSVRVTKRVGKVGWIASPQVSF